MVDIIPKVMLVKEYKEDGTTFWRVPCDCTSTDHDADLWFELDEHGFASLGMGYEVGYYKDWHGGLWRNMKNRVGTAFNILFRGRHTMQGNLMLDREGIVGLQYVLQEGLKSLDESVAQKKNTKKVK
jgi:hypothetical protein